MRKNKKLLFLLIVAFIVRASITLQGFLFLLKNAIVLDDAFIAFSIARNLYSGLGYSFNGIEQTTLTTTLWTLMLVPFSFLTKEAFVVFSSFLSGVLFVLSAIPFYLVLTRAFGGSNVKFLILVFYLFNPFFILISLNGLETSLFIFILMWIFWFYITYARRKPTFLNLVLLNVLLFLLILSREEGYLVFLSLFLDMILVKTRKKELIEFLLVFAIFTIPQFIFRYYLFANPLPSSFNAFLNNPKISRHGLFYQRLGAFILNLSLINTAVGSIFLAIIGILLLKKDHWFDFLPLFLYALLNLIFYSFIIPAGRFRYSFPVSITLSIGLGVAFYFLKEKLRNLKNLSKPVFFIILFFFFGLLSLSALIVWSNIRYEGDSEIAASSNDDIYMVYTAQFLNKNSPENSRIIAGHIGTLQFFLENRSIIDASGKVDYKAGSYLNNRENYINYLESRNASYIVYSLTPKKFESINKNDVVYFEPIYKKPHEPLAYLKGEFTDQVESYIVVLKYKKEYLEFFLP